MTMSTLASERMLDEAWDLSPAVALRPEPFGAMAYHFGNRKLTFLKRMELVEVVRGLAGQPDVRSTLQAADVPEAQWPGYVAALQGLATTDMIRRRAMGEGEGPGQPPSVTVSTDHRGVA